MNRFKLKSKRKYGDMPAGYEFIISASCLCAGGLSVLDIEKEIKRLGFNKLAQSYRAPGNYIVTKLN